MPPKNFCHWFARRYQEECPKGSRKCRNGSLCPYYHLTMREVNEIRTLLRAPTEMKTVECRRCKGSGKISITVIMSGSENRSEISCIDCDARGSITARFPRFAINRILNDSLDRDWCECKEDHYDNYHPDGTHLREPKHCYTCSRCKGITQIG